jgi:hypothetical protein
VVVVIGQDRLPLPFPQPEVAGDPGIVLVDLAIALSPIVVLAASDADPLDQASRRQLRFVRSISHGINHLVSHVRLRPGAVQTSPRLCFASSKESVGGFRGQYCPSDCRRRTYVGVGATRKRRRLLLAFPGARKRQVSGLPHLGQRRRRPRSRQDNSGRRPTLFGGGR